MDSLIESSDRSDPIDQRFKIIDMCVSGIDALMVPPLLATEMPDGIDSYPIVFIGKAREDISQLVESALDAAICGTEMETRRIVAEIGAAIWETWLAMSEAEQQEARTRIDIWMNGQ